MGGRDNRGFILIGQGKGKERIQTGVGRVGCPNPNLISGGVGFEIKKNRGSKGTIGIDRKEMAIGGLIIVEEAEGDQVTHIWIVRRKSSNRRSKDEVF